MIRHIHLRGHDVVVELDSRQIRRNAREILKIAKQMIRIPECAESWQEVVDLAEQMIRGRPTIVIKNVF